MLIILIFSIIPLFVRFVIIRKQLEISPSIAFSIFMLIAAAFIYHQMHIKSMAIPGAIGAISFFILRASASKKEIKNAEQKDKIYSPNPVLKTVVCPRCGSELELDESEFKAKQYTCPKCKNTSAY